MRAAEPGTTEGSKPRIKKRTFLISLAPSADSFMSNSTRKNKGTITIFTEQARREILELRGYKSNSAHDVNGKGGRLYDHSN